MQLLSRNPILQTFALKKGQNALRYKSLALNAVQYRLQTFLFFRRNI